MNKNITLLFLATAFLFAGCKKDNTYADESSILVQAYPITPVDTASTHRVSVSGPTGSGLCLLRASIIAPSSVKMLDHGFIITTVFPNIFIPLGAAHKKGAIQTQYDFGSIILPTYDAVFYAVLANGDSLRSDTPYVIKGASQTPNANLYVSKLTLSTDSISRTHLTCDVTYNTADYYIISEELYYKDPNNANWNIAAIITNQGSLNYFLITGNPAISGFSFPPDNNCSFQVRVTLSPINSNSAPVSDTSDTQTALYN